MCTGLALITANEALLWTDGRYFLQAEQQLTNQWKLMRIGEDPAVDVWMADVRLSCDLLTWYIYSSMIIIIFNERVEITHVYGSLRVSTICSTVI